MRRFLIPVFVLTVLTVLLPLQALAQRAYPTDAIMDALRIGEVLEIMSEESLTNAIDLDQSMLQGEGGSGWARVVRSIHDPQRWENRMRQVVGTQLPAEHIGAVEGFLTSEQGARIVELELSARRAMLDETIEAVSRERLADLEEEGAPLLDRVARFIEANDLVDSNVVGALNSNVAFLEGIQDGAGGPPMGDIYADVWSQEPEIRRTTKDWLMAYLALAYAPLAEEDLEAYIALSESPAGQAFNAAIFGAFDEMFVETSRATGLALGRMMTAEDI